MQMIEQRHFTGERALYGQSGIRAVDCVFEDGESPVKECNDVELFGCMFRYKYPIWYSKNVLCEKCTWFDMARAGVWYCENVRVETAIIEAPKNFRRCRDLTLNNVSLPNAAETLWACENVKLNRVVANGDYFGMNCADVTADDFMLDGNYAFDGVKNANIRNARMLTKDAFWNSENVTVWDSFISGEYLGWNSHNLTFENCVIESLQGLCYIDNLKMVNCKLINTTLAFEYSSVDAQITSRADSVFNPASGCIKASSIGELIVEKDKVDPSKIKIVCKDVAKTSDRPAWLKEN